MMTKSPVIARCVQCILLFAVMASVAGAVRAEDDAAYTRTEDVIYGRKYGLALTMDVFTPKEAPNGAGVIFVVSGGWFSADRAIRPEFVEEFLDRGYTVFAVVHGSQPKFAIPEIIEDLHRSVRFIRYHAEDYGIDAERIGITGASAGGHLSLMMGTAGTEGDSDAEDPVDRISSRVQAVACFFPPTDFLNYGKEGNVALGRGTLANFRAPFDFRELDETTRAFVPITDEERLLEIGREISPIYHVSKDDPPTLIMHGDADKLVPLQQSETFAAKMKKTGATVKLVVKEGGRHGWPGLLNDIAVLADWFDEHLNDGNSNSEAGEK